MANAQRRIPFHSLTVVTQPAHGQVKVTGSRYAYTPEPGFAGRDGFTLAGIPSGSLSFAVTVLPAEQAARDSAGPGPHEQPATGEQSWIGVSLRKVTADAADRLGMNPPAGVLVAAVKPGAPASKAHLRPDDIILAFNFIEVNEPEALRRAINATPPGSSVSVELWRDRRFMTVLLATEAAPGQSDQ